MLSGASTTVEAMTNTPAGPWWPAAAIPDDIAARSGPGWWPADADDELDLDDEPYPPRVPLGLDPGQQVALARAVDAGLRTHGCDSTLRIARAWARDAGLEWRSLRRRLQASGGYCDCEIVFNVLDPDLFDPEPPDPGPPQGGPGRT